MYVCMYVHMYDFVCEKERDSTIPCITAEGDGGALSLDPDAGLSPDTLRSGLGSRLGGIPSYLWML